MTIRQIATVAIAFAYLVAGHGPANAAVLCVGADGHVEMEAAVDGSCVSESDGHSPSNGVEDSFCSGDHENSHCGECMDFPLAFGCQGTCHAAVIGAKTPLKKASAAAATPRVLGALDWCCARCEVVRGALKFPSFLWSSSLLDVTPSTIVCLRTVSLLI